MAGAAAFGPQLAHAAAPDGGMIDIVREYDALGIHRTATPTDDATSHWLQRRLTAAGLAAELQTFPAPLFVPQTCQIAVGGETIPAFPGWPVKATPAAGVTGPLAVAGGGDLAGKIALLTVTREPGGTWAAPGVGDAAMRAARSGALAVAVVTENPTDDVVALNTIFARFDWPVPVVLVAGRHAGKLASAASAGAAATLVSVGDFTPDAPATNVVARRRGRGQTLVVSTPKSGWFHCAGERATGLAVFLDTANWLVRRTDADLVFVAFAGHELNFLGAQHFRPLAPPPAQTEVWLHIGANVAMQPLSVTHGVITPTRASGPQRFVSANPQVLAAAGAAFTADAGYAPATPMVEANAGGELSVFHPDYPMLAGLIGANPLFHTPLDRATVATTPAELEVVAGAVRRFLTGFV